jgi:MFS family permease
VTQTLRTRVHTLTSPLADVSLRRLWYARLVSEAGDWAARLALGLLVFTRTGSALAATSVTAVSLLPHLGIGQLLGTLADRLPHRRVMVVCDVWRGLLFVLLACVDLPVPLALGVAFLAGMADPPFAAAQMAALPLLAGERYLPVLTLFKGTSQAMTLLGFAVGGVLVAVTTPSLALALNGASFLVGVVFIAGIRPTRSSDEPGRRPLVREALRSLTGDRLVVVAVTAVTVSSVGSVAVESLMVSFAAHAGYGATGAGLMATVAPLAAVVTAFVVPSEGRHTRLVRLVCALVAITGAVSGLVFALDSPLPLLLLGFLAVGATDVLTVPAGAVIGDRVPQACRGTAFSFLEGSLALTQAAAAVAAGALATATSAPTASAVLMVPGIAAGLLGLALVRRERGRHAAPRGARHTPVPTARGRHRAVPTQVITVPRPAPPALGRPATAR